MTNPTQTAATSQPVCLCVLRTILWCLTSITAVLLVDSSVSINAQIATSTTTSSRGDTNVGGSTITVRLIAEPQLSHAGLIAIRKFLLQYIYLKPSRYECSSHKLC